MYFWQFSKDFTLPQNGGHLNCRTFAKNGKTQICFYLLNRWVGPCYSIKLKNVKFLKFCPPSSVLSETENVGYLKIFRDRVIVTKS